MTSSVRAASSCEMELERTKIDDVGKGSAGGEEVLTARSCRSQAASWAA